MKVHNAFSPHPIVWLMILLRVPALRTCIEHRIEQIEMELNEFWKKNSPYAIKTMHLRYYPMIKKRFTKKFPQP